MKNYLIWMLLISAALFVACEDDEADFTGGFENKSIEGSWNVTSLWMRECGTFDIAAAIDTTFFIRTIEFDEIIYDTIIIPELEDTTIVPIDTVTMEKDSILFQRNVLVSIDTLFTDEFDPLTGSLIDRKKTGYIELTTNDLNIDSSSFELVITYDTAFEEDLVRSYEICESSWNFNGDGTGNYFVQDRDGGSLNQDFTWSETSSNTLEICMNGDCKSYGYTNSGTGGASLVDNNFNQKECNVAEWSLIQGNEISGNYSWDEILLSSCQNDSIYFFINQDCENPQAEVTALLGSTCFELLIDCQNGGILRQTDGPNEGDLSIALRDLGNGLYDLNFPQTQGGLASAELAINNDNSVTVKFGNEVTLLNGIECQEFEVVFTK